jgi:hypothetical protein
VLIFPGTGSAQISARPTEEHNIIDIDHGGRAFGLFLHRISPLPKFPLTFARATLSVDELVALNWH